MSACVTAHVALATKPIAVLAKPGMGVDEGISIMSNEMARTLCEISVE
jgi:methylaspartate ammonia-lyase